MIMRAHVRVRGTTLWVALVAAMMLFSGAACSSSGRSKASTTSPTTEARAATTASAPHTSATGAHPGGNAVDPCTLLSGRDVEGAGGKSGVHSADDFNGTPGCDYGGVGVYVGFTPAAFDGFAKQGTAVDGVGDRAAYERDWHRIWVATGDTRFMVNCKLCESGTEEATLRQLSTVVLAKLPG